MAGFVLERPLGAGGFGTVWLGRSQKTGHAAAVKVLHARWVDAPAEDGPSIADRFLAEARILERLRHPGIVQLLAIADDRPRKLIAYVMEKLTGYELTHIMTDLELHGLLEVFARVADTLAYVHHQGVIHRDVKLTNIFVCDPQPRAELVKLIDFGVAKDDGTSAPLLTTAAGSFTGTLSSMPPEAIARTSGEDVVLTGAVDQWSVGIALYACLTGRLPFNSMSPLELARMIRETPPPPLRIHGRFGLKEVPPAIEQVVLRCLAKEPDERYPTGIELAAALRAAARTLGARESFADCVKKAAARAGGRGERTLVLAYRDVAEKPEKVDASTKKPQTRLEPPTDSAPLVIPATDPALDADAEDPEATGPIAAPSWTQEDEAGAPTVGLAPRPRAESEPGEEAPTSIVPKPAPVAKDPEVITAAAPPPAPPRRVVEVITAERPPEATPPIVPTVTRPKVKLPEPAPATPPRAEPARAEPGRAEPTHPDAAAPRAEPTHPDAPAEHEAAEPSWNPLIWGVLLFAAAALTFAAVELYASLREPTVIVPAKAPEPEARPVQP